MYGHNVGWKIFAIGEEGIQICIFIHLIAVLRHSIFTFKTVVRFVTGASRMVRDKYSASGKLLVIFPYGGRQAIANKLYIRIRAEDRI